MGKRLEIGTEEKSVMKPYRNASGDSGIAAYEYGPDWIDVWFRGRREPYKYTARGVGAANVNEMKRRADAGKGLATFISTHPKVRLGYDKRAVPN